MAKRADAQKLFTDIGVIYYYDNQKCFVYTNDLRKVYVDRVLIEPLISLSRDLRGTLVQITARRDNNNSAHTVYTGERLSQVSPNEFLHWRIHECFASVCNIVDGKEGYLKPVVCKDGPTFKESDKIYFSFWAVAPYRLADTAVQDRLLKAQTVRCLIIPQRNPYPNALPWRAIKVTPYEERPTASSGAEDWGLEHEFGQASSLSGSSCSFSSSNLSCSLTNAVNSCHSADNDGWITGGTMPLEPEDYAHW